MGKSKVYMNPHKIALYKIKKISQMKKTTTKPFKGKFKKRLGGLNGFS